MDFIRLLFQGCALTRGWSKTHGNSVMVNRLTPLNDYLIETRFGDSELWVLESLGSTSQNVTKTLAKEKLKENFNTSYGGD